MGMTIDDVKHCLKVMVEYEVCEECRLYGTTGTDHCEHDCVIEALNFINKYQKMQADYENRLKADMVAMLTEILTDFDNLIEPNSTRIDCESIIEQKIQALEGKSDGNKVEERQGESS